jgi:hypothetical protein
MRYLLAIVLAFSLMVLLCSCFDPPPGEVSIIATKSGQRKGCAVQLFNTKDVQVDQATTDMDGLVYLKNVIPGKYTLRFVDRDGNRYPAVIKITVDAGEQETVRVDLDQEYDAAEFTEGGEG